jgi:hypothetical protein
MYQYSSFYTYVDCHVTKSKVQAGAVTVNVMYVNSKLVLYAVNKAILFQVAKFLANI